MPVLAIVQTVGSSKAVSKLPSSTRGAKVCPQTCVTHTFSHEAQSAKHLCTTAMYPFHRHFRRQMCIFCTVMSSFQNANKNMTAVDILFKILEQIVKASFQCNREQKTISPKHCYWCYRSRRRSRRRSRVIPHCVSTTITVNSGNPSTRHK